MIGVIINLLLFIPDVLDAKGCQLPDEMTHAVKIEINDKWLHCHITSLPIGYLSNLTWVESLKVQAHVHLIEPGAFAGLNSLKILDLRFNKIGQLCAGLFRDISDLDKLLLGDNQIR